MQEDTLDAASRDQAARVVRRWKLDRAVEERHRYLGEQGVAPEACAGQGRRSRETTPQVRRPLCQMLPQSLIYRSDATRWYAQFYSNRVAAEKNTLDW